MSLVFSNAGIAVRRLHRTILDFVRFVSHASHKMKASGGDAGACGS